MSQNDASASPAQFAEEIGRWAGNLLRDYMVARALILRARAGQSTGPVHLDPVEACLDLHISRADYEMGMRWLQAQQPQSARLVSF
jgi:hypothetical protein